MDNTETSHGDLLMHLNIVKGDLQDLVIMSESWLLRFSNQDKFFQLFF